MWLQWVIQDGQVTRGGMRWKVIGFTAKSRPVDELGKRMWALTCIIAQVTRRGVRWWIIGG